MEMKEGVMASTLRMNMTTFHKRRRGNQITRKEGRTTPIEKVSSRFSRLRNMFLLLEIHT